MQSSIEVKRIDLWTLFRVVFFLYAAIGLIVGLFYAFILMIAGGMGGAFLDEDLPGLGLVTGFLGIILVPVLAFVYGAMGAVVITIGGAIFNLVCRLGGGVRLDVSLVQDSFAPATPAGPTVPPVAPQPQPTPPPPETPPPRPPEPPPEPPRYGGEG